MEKSNDFCDLDSDLIISALQEINKMKPPLPKPMEAGTEEPKKSEDPLEILENHGC